MNHISLAKRMTAVVLLAVVISTLALGVFSYAMERGEVIRAGADRALAVAQTVGSALDPDQYAEIMRMGETNGYYDGYRAFLREVLVKSGAVYLYVLDAAYGAEVTYFAEGYASGVSPDEEEFLLGDTESADVYSDEMYETLATGLDTTTEVYDLGGYGKMISGFAPVLDRSGNVLGVVGVDLPINETMAAANRFGLYMIGIALCVCAAVSFITVVTVKKVFMHLNYMSSALDQIGSEGNLVFPSEVIKSAQVSSAWKNEIGVCAKAFGSTVRRLTYLEGKLKEITAGNLSVDVAVLSEKDEIGIAIAGMVARLNEAFAGILSGAMQVSERSGQISDGAQALASGAVRQAASLQELSGSISEVAERTGQNAEMAEKAARLADAIKGSAEKGGRQMDAMVAAVRDIDQSSRDIGKVIKVIDDIAFRTNILALNAAVEAARAGQDGKGFAVVAEEVRNLAAKSAEAANDTKSLIVHSIEKAALGVRIAGETSSSLSKIVEGINESSRLVSEIAGSSGEQARTIAHIHIGVGQVTQVVQQNSAAAQESADASEEMNGQSEVLRQLISRFRLKEGAARF